MNKHQRSINIYVISDANVATIVKVTTWCENYSTLIMGIAGIRFSSTQSHEYVRQHAWKHLRQNSPTRLLLSYFTSPFFKLNPCVSNHVSTCQAPSLTLSNVRKWLVDNELTNSPVFMDYEARAWQEQRPQMPSIIACRELTTHYDLSIYHRRRFARHSCFTTSAASMILVASFHDADHLFIVKSLLII